MCLFIFVFRGTLSRHLAGDLKENHCSKNILVKFMLWLSIEKLLSFV